MKRAARHATGRASTPLFASRSERMPLTLNSGLLYPNTAPRDTQYPIETLEEAVKKIKSMLTVTRFSPTAVCIKVEPQHHEHTPTFAQEGFSEEKHALTAGIVQ